MAAVNSLINDGIGPATTIPLLLTGGLAIGAAVEATVAAPFFDDMHAFDPVDARFHVVGPDAVFAAPLVNAEMQATP